MKKNNQYLIFGFKGSFYLGIAFCLFALGALAFEFLKNGNWYVESLNGHLVVGLLFIYFSGKPMIDERIQFLRFKALSLSFLATCVIATILNYILTYSDGNQENAISSYWFALMCLLIAFVIFRILKSRE